MDHLDYLKLYHKGDYININKSVCDAVKNGNIDYIKWLIFNRFRPIDEVLLIILGIPDVPIDLLNIVDSLHSHGLFKCDYLQQNDIKYYKWVLQHNGYFTTAGFDYAISHNKHLSIIEWIYEHIEITLSYDPSYTDAQKAIIDHLKAKYK